MSKPFKFRHVNEIAGAFLACIVIVLIVGVVLAGRAQRWFERAQHIIVELPHEGAFGLRAGAEVHMMGTLVGQVDDITIDPDTGQMTAQTSISPRFAKFILIGNGTPNSASQAIIRIPPVLVDPYLEITRGTSGSPIPNKGALIAIPETGASDAINQTLVEVRTRLLPAMESTLDEYKAVADDLRNPNGPVHQTLAHLDHLTADLQQTAVELPKIAHSASMQMDKMPAMLDQTTAVMSEAEKSLKNLQQTTAQLPAVVASLKQTVDALPDVMVHTQQTLIELQKLIRGMQELPFIRENVEHAQPNTTLQPADVGGPP
jgi:phospholipid/cholesterol/gamma-HCH transport system substrate-binding protein